MLKKPALNAYRRCARFFRDTLLAALLGRLLPRQMIRKFRKMINHTYLMVRQQPTNEAANSFARYSDLF